MNFTQEQLEQMAIDYLSIKESLLIEKNNKEVLKLKNQQENIIKKLKCLINIRSFKYKKFSNFIDLEQEGFEALIMALNTFKPNKSSFTWWADKYISTRLSRAANAHSTVRVPIKYAKDMKPLKSSNIPLMVDDRNGYSELEEKYTSLRVMDAINKLPDMNKKFMIMLYGLNGIRQHNITQLCEHFSLNKSESIKLISESKKQLKNILQTYEIV